MSKSTDFPTHRSQLSAAKQTLLEKRLRGELARNSSGAPIITRRSEQSTAPLSFAQQRLWFLNQLEPGSAAYNLPRAIYLTGLLNTAALEQSLNEIVRRHEILRTTFETTDSQPIQRIAPAFTLTLPVVNLQELSKSEREQTIQQLVIEEAQRPFSLNQGPLVRVVLLQLSQVEHIVLLTLHHIVSDAWSTGVLVQEMAALYEAFLQGNPSPLPDLSIQYADFASWQRQWLQGKELESQLVYWRQQLGGDLSVLQIPTDRPRLAVQTGRGARQSLILTKELTEALKTLSQQEDATLFMTLLAAFKTLLYRYTGQEDILVGSPIANRNQAEVESLIGFFVNTLVLRSDLSGNPSFRELMRRVREVCLGAYAHQDLPFELLVEKLQPERNLSRIPLFQVMFALQNASVPTLKLPGLTLSSLKVETKTAQLDLSLDMMETEQGLSASIEYSTDLFEAATIARMLEHFQILLAGIVAKPNQPLSDLPLLTQAEQQQLLVEWNNTQIHDQPNQCIHELFEAQVAQSPDAIAVISEDKHLTYWELNVRANQLAHHLESLSVRPEVPVGIYVEQSPEMVIGLLAILKAGGAYVPIDPAYPQERIALILQDAQLKVLLTQQHLIENLSKHQTRIVCLDKDWETIAQENPKNLINNCTTDNLAYIIYTSGSTGQPKGVLVNHASVIRLLAATQPWYNFNQQDIWTLFHSIAFDFSVWEIWGALLYGGQLVVIPYWLSRSPQDFYKLLLTQQVTILNQTPSAFCQLIQVEESLRTTNKLNLRLVIFGGEALQLESLRPWFEQHDDQLPQLVNMYGITETTVHVTYRPLKMADLEAASGSVIGRPIPDLQVYLLDQYLQPVPIGVPGEIYVGGAGVARGYLNRPELTAQRFISNLFSSKPNARLYKSGDLARYLPNGDIEYLGRIDHQVKVRGFRIELGEVETVLRQHPAVLEAVVAVQAEHKEKLLVAYLVTHQESVPKSGELRWFLKNRLPEYMVPGVFVLLDTLPLTPNGKLDRQALPAPEASRPELETAYVAPQSDLEQAIAKIWQKILNVERVGIHDSFFELGGHSLLLVQVHSQLKERFKADLLMLDLFRYPTVSALAAYFGQVGYKPLSEEAIERTEQIKDGKARRQQRLQKMQSTAGRKGVDAS